MGEDAKEKSHSNPDRKTSHEAGFVLGRHRAKILENKNF